MLHIQTVPVRFEDYERENVREHILVEGGLLAYDDELSGEITCGLWVLKAVTGSSLEQEKRCRGVEGSFINWAVNMEILDKEVEKWKRIP